MIRLFVIVEGIGMEDESVGGTVVGIDAFEVGIRDTGDFRLGSRTVRHMARWRVEV